MEITTLFVLCLAFISAQSQGPKLDQVTDPVVHAEGPHWDPIQQVLFYVDITSRWVLRYDPVTGQLNRVFIDGRWISPVITVEGEGDEFVVGRASDLLWLRWDGVSETPSETKVLAQVQTSKPDNRFNDGKADSKGRIWMGTMKEGPNQTNEAAFFRFQYLNNFEPKEILPQVTISNGLAWNDNDTLMYYIDSPTRRVDVFDFDSDTGDVSNRRGVFNFTENGLEGDPDGMCIDSDDNIWVAAWGGWSVHKIDPVNKKLLQTIQLPAAQVSSCAFGGPLLDTLYITTSRVGLSDEQIAQQPRAGAVFSVTGLGVTGQMKPNKVRIQ